MHLLMTHSTCKCLSSVRHYSLSSCLSVSTVCFLPARLSICLTSLCLSQCTCQPACLSLSLTVCFDVGLSACLLDSMSVCLPICLHACLPAYLYARRTISLSLSA